MAKPVKQDTPTAPVAPPNPGNPNAPANPNPAAPQSGVVQIDPNTNLPVAKLNINGKEVDLVLNSNLQAGSPVGVRGGYDQSDQVLIAPGKNDKNTFENQLNSISEWYGNLSIRQKYINEMYAAGLISSKKSPSVNEVTLAWQLIVQEAALQTADGNAQLSTPDQVLASAAKQGWNNINAKQAIGDVGANGTGNPANAGITNSQSQTIYTSYVDPATAMGTLADAYYRLMGRNPNPGEYKAFLDSLYNYQDQENTGKFESKTTVPNMGNVDPSTGQPVDSSGSSGGTSTQTNVVSQRSVGTRGVEFLAGQQALANPEAAQYQAATTVFSSIIKALGAPGAAGDSGPTTTAP